MGKSWIRFDAFRFQFHERENLLFDWFVVGFDNLKETIEANYRKVKQEILLLVDSEIERIKNDSMLSNLVKG